jgi:hypothetical protein
MSLRRFARTVGLLGTSPATNVSPEQRHRQAVFARDGLRCCMEDEECGGRLQAHHPVTRQALRTNRKHWMLMESMGKAVPTAKIRLLMRPIGELIADPRNGMVVCEVHHSRPWDLAEREPEHVKEFRREYGF